MTDNLIQLIISEAIREYGNYAYLDIFNKMTSLIQIENYLSKHIRHDMLEYIFSAVCNYRDHMVKARMDVIIAYNESLKLIFNILPREIIILKYDDYMKCLINLENHDVSRMISQMSNMLCN